VLALYKKNSLSPKRDLKRWDGWGMDVLLVPLLQPTEVENGYLLEE
jgi:hypothetical protein